MEASAPNLPRACAGLRPAFRILALPVIAAFLLSLVSPHALALPAAVGSTNDGDGWYSYTFERGNEPYVWGIDPQNGAIQMQSYGVLEILDPPGWKHTLSDTGLIQWRTTEEIIFLDAPVVLRLRSCLTESVNYHGLGPGYILGAVFALPERTLYLGGGYQAFDFVGPALPQLSVEKREGKLVVSWSARAQGMILEVTERPADASSWTAVGGVTGDAERFAAEFPLSGPGRFFRLRSSCSPGE
jgi:hypothetical protein